MLCLSLTHYQPPTDARGPAHGALMRSHRHRFVARALYGAVEKGPPSNSIRMWNLFARRKAILLRVRDGFVSVSVYKMIFILHFQNDSCFSFHFQNNKMTDCDCLRITLRRALYAI